MASARTNTRACRHESALKELHADGVQHGDPDFHQLEPDVELAKPTPGAPRSRIVKRAGVYESLPAEWSSAFGAGDSVAEHMMAFIATNDRRSAAGR